MAHNEAYFEAEKKIEEALKSGVKQVSLISIINFYIIANKIGRVDELRGA